MLSLTEQQRLYSEARMAGLSKKDSAIAAGCPEKTAAQAASRLEKHPNVRAHLARLKALESDKNPIAGRDAAPPSDIEAKFFEDPIEMLQDAMNNPRLDIKTRLDVAKSLLPYKHAKVGESGKKETLTKDAENVVRGRFKPAAPPQMKLV